MYDIILPFEGLLVEHFEDKRKKTRSFLDLRIFWTSLEGCPMVSLKASISNRVLEQSGQAV